jgi:hypothetical protein
VIDNARSASLTDPDVYSNSWKQPPVAGTAFEPSNQVLAISALLPGIVLAVNDPGQNTPSPSPSSQSSSSPRRPPLGSILGGVLGAVFLLLLLGAVAFMYMRRRRARRIENHIDPLQPPTPEVRSRNVETRKHQQPYQPSDYRSSENVTSTYPGSQPRSSVNEMSTTQLISALRERLTAEQLNSSVTDPPPEYRLA